MGWIDLFILGRNRQTGNGLRFWLDAAVGTRFCCMRVKMPPSGAGLNGQLVCYGVNGAIKLDDIPDRWVGNKAPVFQGWVRSGSSTEGDRVRDASV